MSTMADIGGSLAKLAQLDSSISGAIEQGAKDAAGQAVDQVTHPVDTLTKGVMIVLGLLLIAAGIFSFDKVKTVVVDSAKSAATAA
jgi:predicted transporter